MKRYKSFLKQTWYLWLSFSLVTTLLIMYVSPIFIAVLPMMLVIFVYFALVRYNDDGDFIGA